MEPDFPLEFIVPGTPVSLQTKRLEAKIQWQQRIKDASFSVLPEGHWVTDRSISITLFYFPDAIMQGDIDNIVKPILDAFNKHIYFDDSQVERVVVQKFDPGKIFKFTNPSDTLESALLGNKPLLYIRMSTDPFEELA